MATAYGPLAVFLISLIVNGTFVPEKLPVPDTFAAHGSVIIWMHRTNIERLMRQHRIKIHLQFTDQLTEQTGGNNYGKNSNTRLGRIWSCPCDNG